MRDQWPKVGPIILFLLLNTFLVLLLLKGYESRFRMMSEWAAMICVIAYIGPIVDTIFQRLKLKKLRHPGR